jgi:hypothetical protein
MTAPARTPLPPPPPMPSSGSASPAGPSGTSASNGAHDLAARLREAAAGTPGTLRLLGIGCVVVLVVFGVLGALSARSRADAITDARDESAQLVRLQSVRTNLVRADSLATNAFLVGGLEPAQQRESYEAGLRNATQALTDAAANSAPADAAALRGVSDAITRYAGLVEAARANNRQGFPVGVAYLRQASSVLRSEVLPVLSELSDTTQSRVKHAYRDSRSANDLLALGVIVAIVMLAITQAYLTVRTRRLVSLPLAISAGIVVVATLLATAVMAWSQAQMDDVRDGDYRSTVALAQARIFAFDAKSAESLTLILRGSGAAEEARFQSLADSTEVTLRDADVDPAHLELFGAYRDVHDQIRTLDDGGQWDEAVELATQIEGGANSAFQAFADSTSGELDATAANIADDLDDARTPLPIAAIVLVLAGLAAAIAAWQGIAARLKEYR